MTGKFVPFEQGTTPDWSILYQFVGAANGYSLWGKIWSLTSLSDDTNYEMSVRNLGSSGGGRHIQTLHSVTNTPVVQLTDAGIVLNGTLTGYPVGHLAPYAGASAPAKWLIADGSVVSQTTYALLYAVCGATYNTGGEGAGNFRLPDMRGKVALGVSGAFALGSTGGATTTSLVHHHTGPSHHHTGPSHLHAVDDHSHGMGAHDHGSGSYATENTSALITGTVFEAGSGGGTDLDTTVTLVHGGSSKVAMQLHTHNINDILLDITGDSNTGLFNTGDARNNTAFESTESQTGLSTGLAGTGDTGNAGTGDTGDALGTVSILPPYVALTWIIYTAV